MPDSPDHIYVVDGRIDKGKVADSKLKGPKFNRLGCEINF